MVTEILDERNNHSNPLKSAQKNSKKSFKKIFPHKAVLLLCIRTYRDF